MEDSFFKEKKKQGGAGANPSCSVKPFALITQLILISPKSEPALELHSRAAQSVGGTSPDQPS